MSRVTVNEQYLQDTADAIREKTGEVGTYKPSQFANAIADISSGGGSGWTDITSLCTIDGNNNMIAIDENDLTGHILYASLGLIVDQNYFDDVLACFFVYDSSSSSSLVCGEAIVGNGYGLLSIGTLSSSVKGGTCQIMFYNEIDPNDNIQIVDLFWLKKIPLPT